MYIEFLVMWYQHVNLVQTFFVFIKSLFVEVSTFKKIKLSKYSLSNQIILMEGQPKLYSFKDIPLCMGPRC